MVQDQASKDVALNSLSQEYCVNQSNAIKVLQDIRDSNAEVATLLQRIRDGPSARNLDLSSYLLIPSEFSVDLQSI